MISMVVNVGIGAGDDAWSRLPGYELGLKGGLMKLLSPDQLVQNVDTGTLQSSEAPFAKSPESGARDLKYGTGNSPLADSAVDAAVMASGYGGIVGWVNDAKHNGVAYGSFVEAKTRTHAAGHDKLADEFSAVAQQAWDGSAGENAMNGWDYQAADRALLDVWLGRPTLATALSGFSTWRGFYGDLKESDAQLTEPVDPPALPAMGAFHQLRYTQPVRRALDGSVKPRHAVAEIYLRIQSALVTGDDAWTKMMEADSQIKQSINTESGTAMSYGLEIPCVPSGLRLGWPEYVTRISLFPETTA